MKNNNNNTATSGGIGVTGLLTVAFIVLKLCGVITWSWWWVLSPVWISVGIVVLVLLIGLIVTLLELALATRKGKRK